MQLPAPQLIEVFTMCPDLKQPLRDHLNTFTEAQRVHVPVAVQDIITGRMALPPPSSVHSSPVLMPRPEQKLMVIADWFHLSPDYLCGILNHSPDRRGEYATTTRSHVEFSRSAPS